jgi:hypothetical protein
MAEEVKLARATLILEFTVDGDDDAALPIKRTWSASFKDGAGANLIGNVWQDKGRTLNGAEDLDFGSGGLLDFQGQDVGLTDSKLVFLHNTSTTPGENLSLTLGGANPITGILSGTNPKLTVGPQGVIFACNPIDGWTVTDGSADTLGVETSASLDYGVIVAGKNT